MQLDMSVATESKDRVERQEESAPGVCFGDVMGNYGLWSAPVVIVSDGPYGLGSYPGDPPVHEQLADWYRPHIEEWSRRATPSTTLWFWNSEIGWASVHPVLIEHGWKYRACHVWDKGKAHIAGNANSKTLRMFPVVTEVCVQYVREPVFTSGGNTYSVKEWLRREWERTGLALSLANEACGVKNAATRKYLTLDHLWYYPPGDAFESLAQYANTHGAQSGMPFFSADGHRPIGKQEWDSMRAKFYCAFGVNNVWREPPVNGKERLRGAEGRAAHMNQKPLRLMEICIRASSDEGDVVWEPFGGLCSATVAALRLGRRGYSAEIREPYYAAARQRLIRERMSVKWGVS